MSETSARICPHPLAGYFLTRMRDKQSPPELFRESLEQLTSILLLEATRDLLELPKKSIETPLETFPAGAAADPRLCGVSILRAGNGMLPAFSRLFPEAPIGHIGLARSEEGRGIRIAEYYLKLPKGIEEKTVLLLDPMLASGNSALTALRRLEEQGCKKIRFVCALSCPEGIAKLESELPGLEIFTGAVDRELNENAYILPGLGDAGDRIYGTL